MADALICGVGLLCSVPFLYGVMLMALPGPLWTVYLLCFFGLWFINLNWALVGDILLVFDSFFFFVKNYFFI